MQRHAAGSARTRLRVEHLFHDRQMLGQPGRAFVLGGWTRRGRFHCQGRLGRCRWLRGGRLCDALEQKLELRRIELLAVGAKESAHQRVDLLAQERVLTLQMLVALLQLGFAGAFAQDESEVISMQPTWIEPNA